MQIQLLHNPKAGMADHGKLGLVAALAAKGSDVAYCSTKDDAFPNCLSEAEGPVIIAGGDGTVAKVIKHLGNRTRPLGILPLGGSNNIATSLGFDRKIMQSGIWPERATEQAFHLGKIVDSRGATNFLEGVGFGTLAASMTRKSPPADTVREKIQNGRRLIADALAELEAVIAEVFIDDQLLAGRWLMAETLTLSHSGPRLPLAKSSQGLRRRLSLILLEEERRTDMIAWLMKPEAGSTPVRVFEGHKVSFRVPKGTHLRVDDEITRAGEHGVELEVDDDPVHFLIPIEGSEEGA